jgi:alanine-synthesizing transaminase
MRFSDLTVDFPDATNRLYKRLEELRQAGTTIVDLVNANVNDHGIVFPNAILAPIMADATRLAATYKPDSLGQRVAREAVALYEGIEAEQILLTPGTSVSYWYAFKLLCEPGSEVLCPAPSYPLFDYIARLAGIDIRNYRLNEQDAWSIDLEHLRQQISDKTRAIVVISPHNPTGMVAGQEQVDGLAELAARHNLPIISDEVFREFVDVGVDVARPWKSDAPLVFTLNGFSKMFALPGIKIGWMGVSGDKELVGKSMRTLELMSDTFLPVNEAAQFATGQIFEKGEAFLKDYREEIGKRRKKLARVMEPGLGVPPRGGFHAVVTFERDVEEEDLAIELLNTEHILVHPGYFYDIEGRHIVMSCVSPVEVLGDSLERIKAHL